MKKILVIDDDETVRSVVTAFLGSVGFHTIQGENGRVGVQLAKEHNPDLIICDVQMPELDGYGVLKALGENPSTADIPFIFLTGKGGMSDLREGMNLGADDYLVKPFRRDELLKAVDMRLSKKEAIAERYSAELRQAEEKLDHLMHYDLLTGLPNRLMLRDRMQKVTGATLRQRLLGVFSVGLDRFRRINDTLGPLAGDSLLKAVAERLLTCVGGRDTVARLQADQFVVIVASMDSQHELAELAQHILETLLRPFVIDKQEIFTTASIGISLYPTDGTNIDHLIRNAETSMRQAKKKGGNLFEFYSSEIQTLSPDQLALEASLRYALERRELELFYQPQVELQTGEIVGAEALVRWNHPERGRISPGLFIPLAEETGLIIPIGEWVLRTACLQARQWQDAGFRSFRVSVNLSGTQFNQQNLNDRLVKVLADSQIDPRHVDLELTESILMQNASAAEKTLSELKTLGLRISIDDFGTGYSSLSYLKRFPFDVLKIDQSFIRNVTVDSKNAAITMAIIQMAHNLNLKVIAEGVETVGELLFLSLHACNEMQGYLFSPPLPAQDLENLLRSGKRLQIQQG